MLFSSLYYHYFPLIYSYNLVGGGRGRDCGHMVIGFTTTYEISAYHHWSCEFESRSGRGAEHYVIKFVSDWRQVGGFQRVLRFPHDISSQVLVLEVSILHLSTNFLLVCGAVSTVWVCVGFFAHLCILCFWFFFIWIICVSFKSVSMTFRKLKVNYFMRYICLPVI